MAFQIADEGSDKGSDKSSGKGSSVGGKALFPFLLTLLVALFSCASLSSEVSPSPVPGVVPEAAKVASTTVAFKPSSENFTNPERGFAFENDPPWPDRVTWGFCGEPGNFEKYDYTAWNDPLKLEFLRQERLAGRSLLMSRYHLADFRNRDLTPEYLAFLRRDFAVVRQAGLKMVPRFAYNYPMGGPDASLARILGHLEQLRSVLRENADVIAFLEAGFVGCWGEWHTSSNGLDSNGDANGYGMSSAKRQIVDKLLEVLPVERMVALRVPREKFSYFGSADVKPIVPLSVATAFNGSNRARVGHHDDCFVCSDSHGGSYFNPRDDLSETPTFLAQENLFVPQGGEPGDPETINPNTPGNANSPLSSCPTVLKQFAATRWSVVGLFNIYNDASAIQRWQRDGCYDEITRRLGYRFRLLEASAATSALRNSSLTLRLKLTNDGWSRPFNPRALEVVLREKTTGKTVRLEVKPAQDVRLFLPGPGETKTLELKVNLPATLLGTYSLLLNLPDPMASLRQRPEYSIRLANTGLWEPLTGFNALNMGLEIKP